MKKIGLLAAVLGMMALEIPLSGEGNGRKIVSSATMTLLQKKKRAKAKMARKSRKANRKHE